MKKLKKLIFLLSITLNTIMLNSQNEFSKWYFGNTGLNFQTTPPSILSAGIMQFATCGATISDSNGNLLFYSNGNSIANASNSTMANGSNLNGSPSDGQAVIAVKQPGNANIFYLFTTPYLSYSIVDMSLAAGLGSVTVKNSTLVPNSTYKQVAVRHCNGVDAWVVSHDLNSNQFRSYLLTAAGLNTVAVISTVGNVFNIQNALGHMKISPDGRKLAVSNFSTTSTGTNSPPGFYLFDFDPATGFVSNSVALKAPYTGAFGIEFSPDGTKLYGVKHPYAQNMPGELFQWDVCSSNTTVVTASEYSISIPYQFYGSLQKAIDGKLYLAANLSQSLSVIRNPNATGTAMNFVLNDFSLGSNGSDFGLPNYINKGRIVPTSANISQTISCQSVNFAAPAYTALTACSNTSNPYTGYVWDFGDTYISSTMNATHTYSALGTFTVRLVMYGPCYNDTLYKTINITTQGPTVSVSGNMSICKGDSRIYTASGGTNYSWSGSSTTASTITLSPTTNSIYTVTAISGSCSDSKSFTVSVNGCSGINESNKDQEIDFYPNPASNILNISSSEAGQFTLMDMGGRIVIQQKANSGSAQISITEVPAGMYIAQFQTDNGLKRERIVIAR